MKKFFRLESEFDFLRPRDFGHTNFKRSQWGSCELVFTASKLYGEPLVLIFKNCVEVQTNKYLSLVMIFLRYFCVQRSCKENLVDEGEPLVNVGVGLETWSHLRINKLPNGPYTIACVGHMVKNMTGTGKNAI